MKEILFKAKRIDNSEWVSGYYFCMCHTDKRHLHHFIIPLGADLNKGTPIDSIQVEVDPNTICRCTGREDINGTLIWENDFVSFLDVSQYDNGYSEHWCIGKVVWDEETLSFQVTERISCESYEVLNEDCQVAGNIFDNPELL